MERRCECGCGGLMGKPKDPYRPARFIAGHQKRLRGAQWDITETGCWISRYAPSNNGYAKHGGIYVHRENYERVYGPIPPGLDLDHLCRVRNCVNPAHLEPVTRLVNVIRGARAKLTIQQVREIREQLKTGKTYRALAEAYGVSIDTINRIKGRRTWAIA